jgi:hypothetical protein
VRPNAERRDDRAGAKRFNGVVEPTVYTSPGRRTGSGPRVNKGLVVRVI